MTIHSAKFDLESGVKLSIASDTCCNCSSVNALSPVQTELKQTRYLVFGGTEITLKLSFPYCPSCAETAKRKPMGTGAKLLISFVLFSLS